MKIKMCYGTLAFLLLCCACSTEWEIPPLDSSDRVDEDVLNPVIQEARNYSEQYVKDYHSVFEKREMLPTKGNANGLQPVWSKAQVKKRSGFLKVEVPMLSENPKKQHVNYFIQGKKYELEVEPSTRMVMAKHREDGRYGCYLTSSLILPSISGATADDTIMIDHSPDGRMLIVGGHIDGEVKLFQKTAAQWFEHFKVEKKVNEKSGKVTWHLRATFATAPEEDRGGCLFDGRYMLFEFEKQFKDKFSRLPESIKDKIPYAVVANVHINAKGEVFYVHFMCDSEPVFLTDEEWMLLYDIFKSVKINNMKERTGCPNDFKWTNFAYMLGSRQKANKEKKP